jgi:hypothetical protein
MANANLVGDAEMSAALLGETGVSLQHQILQAFGDRLFGTSKP